MIIKHILIEGKLQNNLTAEEITESLLELPKIMGMKTLGELQIEEGSEKLPGFSGVQLIETSHMNIHSFDNEKIVLIDILSCEDFSEYDIIKYLERKFNFEEYKIL